MKIQHKLTLLFTSVIASLLFVFAMVIYFAYAENREDEYFNRLRQQAVTKADLLLDARVDPKVLQLIYQNSSNSLFQEEVAIYDTAFHLLYHDAVEVDLVKETLAMMEEIRQKKEIQFYQQEKQAVGFLYWHQGKPYLITAAAHDEYGLSKLQNLQYTLIVSLLVSTVFILLASRFFAKQALKPVSELVEKVEEISATNLDLRVNEGNRKDEIAELAMTFNRMLNRLEQSFNAQKEFVSNISHELRTPLAAIVAELGLAASKERTLEEYQQVISRSIQDVRKLVKLSNGLLDLAKASYDQAEIAFRKVRVDELLLDARQDVLQQNPGYKASIVFDQEPECDDDLTVNGNKYLLKVAFVNLIENGCKFSPDRQSTVAIGYSGKKAILRFEDRGIGISQEDLPHLFTFFFRGGNQKYSDGNGIGLALTQKIISLHQGRISVASQVNQGSTFTIEFPL